MNYDVGKMSGKGDYSPMWLEDKKIDANEYLKVARKAAKNNGYDPTKVHFSNDSKHKLYYDTQKSGNNEKEDAVHFGARDYNDYIIYTLTKNTNADKYRKAYLARATNIKGDWEKDKYSPNNLAIKILW